MSLIAAFTTSLLGGAVKAVFLLHLPTYTTWRCVKADFYLIFFLFMYFF